MLFRNRSVIFIATLGLVLGLSFLCSKGLNRAGIFFYRAERFQKAQDCYELAIRVNPYNLAPLHNLGLLEKDRRHFQQAETIYRRIITRRPEWGLVHKSLGACLQLQGRTSEAVKEYKLAVALDPQLVSAWNNLGVIYFHQDRRDAALVCYDKALRLCPTDPVVRANLARLTKQEAYHETRSNVPGLAVSRTVQ